MTTLVTGAAGFIGFHLAQRLLDEGRDVVGVDNLNDYYDVSLKQARLDRLRGRKGFRFVKLDIADKAGLDGLFAEAKFQTVINFAAQAGVRYSLVDPKAYVASNLDGFVNILEGCRHHGIKHLVYASSSSVYGASTKMPFSVHDHTDHPISLYGATKKANEVMAHSYSHLFSIPTTGVRFFTVYGPWSRPDMAMFLFTRAILTGEPIQVFNYGNMERDFIFIDDIVEAVLRVAKRIPAPDPTWDSSHPDPASSSAPYRLYNIGNSKPANLSRLIEILEECLGRKAKVILKPMQPGDVAATYADVSDLARDIGFTPHTPIEQGIERFVRWYRDYHQV